MLPQRSWEGGPPRVTLVASQTSTEKGFLYLSLVHPFFTVSIFIWGSPEVSFEASLTLLPLHVLQCATKYGCPKYWHFFKYCPMGGVTEQDKQHRGADSAELKE